ncbi:hypothetical protein Nepgr_028834 [Nepenthes gracilis]|uniref:Uncharacterized protein n=1 Tax=Nepenthes gracilis TaxID=150966 RepID=A0AAD3TDS4_NEPGR|nr:hypothetical protein Nepgr_028834 [Nepenthes gracilis]
MATLPIDPSSTTVAWVLIDEAGPMLEWTLSSPVGSETRGDKPELLRIGAPLLSARFIPNIVSINSVNEYPILRCSSRHCSNMSSSTWITSNPTCNEIKSVLL